MDSQQVLARFEAERQALALMDHPNIARVLDAGVTERGRPYFAMEYVEGVALTDYCDAERLSVQERLKLFMLICNAVQHAHQKGIIHRDLKPSNILVSTYDGKPVPKVIDFGLAKAVNQPLTEQTMLTAHGMLVGTPLYMSPEQAQVQNLDIDTRTDVYSLGVILYELLTGTTPLERKQFKEAAVAEIFRLIKEVDPPCPSTRLSTSDSLPSVAAQRNIEPTHLKRSLTGDLDWVVMRALEKERSRRYETASGLADDIRRHLADEPVSAGPPSARYRLQKFVRRNRAAVIAGGLVAATLILGVLGTTSGLVWALREKTRADQQAQAATAAAKAEERQRQVAVANAKQARVAAARSDAVAEFLTDALAGVGPSVALGRDTTLLREILQRTTARVETELADQPEVEATMREAISTTYWELGDYEKAESHRRRAKEIYDTIYPDDHPLKASQLGELGLILEQQNQIPTAERHYRDALAMRSRLGLATDDDREAETLRNLATLLTYEDRKEEAHRFLEQAHQKLVAFHGTDEHADVATVINAFGNLARRQGDFDEARRRYERALEVHRQVLPPNHPFIATDMMNLAGLLEKMNEFEAAESMLRDAIVIQRNVVDQHPQLAESLGTLGSLLHHLGRFEEAERALEEAIAIGRKVFADSHPSLKRYQTSLAMVFSADGRVEAAFEIHQRLLQMDLEHAVSEGDLITSYNNIAFSLMELERLEEAEQRFREAIAIARKSAPDGSEELAMCLNNLGRCLLRCERLDAAIEQFEQAVAMRKRLYGDSHSQIANSLNSLGNVYAEKGDIEKAVQVKREAVAMYTELLGPTHLYTAIALGSLAQVLSQQHTWEEANRLFQESFPAISEAFGPTHVRTIKHDALHGEVLARLGQLQEARSKLTRAHSNLTSDEQNAISRDMRVKIKLSLGQVLTQLNEFEEAEKLLLEARDLASQPPALDLGPDRLPPSAALKELYEAWHEAQPETGPKE